MVMSVISVRSGSRTCIKALLVTTSPLDILPKSSLPDTKSNSTWINAVRESMVSGLIGSFDLTVIVFFWFPFLWAVLKVTSIFPSPPGGMSVSVRTAAVHPHPPPASISFSGASPALRTTKVCETLVP